MHLAWKEIKHNRKNFIMIGITIMLMIFMVIFLSGLANGLGRAISAGIDRTGAENFAITSDAEDLIAASNIAEEDAKEIRNQTSDKTALFNVKRTYITMKDSDEKEGFSYFGMEPDSFIKPEVSEGKTLGNKKNTIVVNELLKEDGVEIGDVITDSASGVKLTVIGFAKEAYYNHVSVGYVSMETYVGMEKVLNPNYQVSYNAVAIKGNDIHKISVKGIEVLDRATIIENLPGYSAERITITMIKWVLVIITGAILAVFFYIITIQKRKQYGVMKALGMRNGEIAGVLMKQISVLSCGGTACGVLLAYLMSLVLPPAMPFYFKLSDALVIAAAFILISVIGGMMSVLNVAKVDPVAIIGGAE